MRLLKRRSQRLVACAFCLEGWRWFEGKYQRCSECGGSGDFVSRRDT